MSAAQNPDYRKIAVIAVRLRSDDTRLAMLYYAAPPLSASKPDSISFRIDGSAGFSKKPLSVSRTRMRFSRPAVSRCDSNRLIIVLRQ